MLPYVVERGMNFGPSIATFTKRNQLFVNKICRGSVAHQ
jgi:hypothetical protein